MSSELGYRTFSVRADDPEGPPRGILTTEQPVEMFDWQRGEYVPEVLLMSGMKARGQSIKLLDSHQTGSVRDVLGSFENIATHPAGERGVPYSFVDGSIRISETESDIATKVRERHINEMSVGYRFSEDKTEHIPAGETREIGGQTFVGPVNVRTEWQAQEASLVPIGADDQAQIRGFRSIEDARQKISRKQEERTSDGVTPAADRGADDKAPAETERTEKTQTNTNPPKKDITMSNENEGGAVLEEARNEGLKAGRDEFQKRADAILPLGEEVGDPSWALSELQSERTVEEVQKRAIAKLREQTVNVGHNIESAGDVGMSKKERRSYSIANAMLALAEGRKVDGLEGEVSDFISQRCDRSPDGFFVAPEALRGSGERAVTLTAGTSTDGDELVSNDLRAGDFIDVLRPNMVSAQAGIRILNGLVGDAIIPRKSAASAASWAGNEVTTAHAQSEPQFDTVTLTPQHLGCYTDVSKQLLHQGTPDVDSLIRDDLNQAVAVGLDKAVFQGTGSGQPQGIDGATSVPTSTITTAGEPSKAELFEFLEDVDTGNALMGTLSWVTTPAIASYLKQTLIDSGVSGYMWDMSTNTVLGYQAFSTSQAATGDIFYGNFSDYIMGIFDGIDIVFDPYSGAKNRLVTYVLNVMADGDVRRPASFCTNA